MNRAPWRWLWWAALGLAVFTYFYGLDSQHIPKNGDEFPYEHITRLTAASGKLLPLQSELSEMRNTKPPLLFWQGIVATDWGRDWTLLNLRYPSVLYTLLTAALAFLLAWRLSGRTETGVLAALVFLAFFNTYRYGRPFLTDPPEIFWLSLPFFALLYWRERAFASRIVIPLVFGIGIGIGLLYKSFALIVPVGFALSWWYLHHRQYRLTTFLLADAWKIAVMGVIALAIFGAWFLLDPDPQAIWREFVVGENVGKMDPHGDGYVTKLLWGDSSIWSLALAFLANAGLLAFPVIGLLIATWRRRAELSDAEKLLWILILALLVVFSLPSQRSGRYLLPAMPALAVLCALNWDQISRKAFVASLVVAGALIGTFAYLSLRMQQALPDTETYPLPYWLLVSGSGALIAVALFVPRFTRPATPVAAILVLLSLAAFLGPLDGPLGNYATAAQRYAQGKQVGVPCNFRAKDETYRFILPGAAIHGYRSDRGATLRELTGRYQLVAVRLPLLEQVQAECPDCKIIGERLELRDRQSSAELKEMFLQGNVVQHLFAREYLIESPTTNRGVTSPREGDECHY